MVNKIEEKYQTRDGEEFSSIEDAQRHEAVLVAQDVFEDAQRNFAQVLLENTKTADGELVTIGGGAKLYCVQQGVYRPSMFEVDLWWRFLGVDDYSDDPVIVYHHPVSGAHGDRGPRKYKISEMYAHRKNAVERFIELKREHIAWLENDIAKLAN